MPTRKKKTATPQQIIKYGHVASTIRAAMKRKGLDRSELGRALGYDKNPTAAVSHWVDGKSAPTGERRTRLAAVLEVSEADLTARDPHEAPPDLPSPYSNRELSVNRGRPPSGKKALIFEINADGTAKIALDLQTSQEKAVDILQMLLKAGIDPTTTTTEDDA